MISGENITDDAYSFAKNLLEEKKERQFEK
jgi:hypothetical protein